MSVWDKIKIRGKVYYKFEEEKVSEEDKSFISAVWHLTNPSGEEFRLIIGAGKKPRYTLCCGKQVLFKPKSISLCGSIVAKDERAAKRPVNLMLRVTSVDALNIQAKDKGIELSELIDDILYKYLNTDKAEEKKCLKNI